jgi:hypothetical protein
MTCFVLFAKKKPKKRLLVLGLKANPYSLQLAAEAIPWGGANVVTVCLFLLRVLLS